MVFRNQLFVTNNPWDVPIDLPRLWAAYRHVIKPGGAIVLTSMGRFTGQLIESNPEWFRYKMVWIKSIGTNFLNAHKQPLRRHEDLCVFYGGQATFHPQKRRGKPYDKGVRQDKSSGSYGAFGKSRG
jgi:site-specific DNA-methyltransferase (adenine-specific)/modification methylase